jgi:hydroxymethylbilane synthase
MKFLMADLPVTELNPDLAIAAIPIRESPYDVLVSQRNKTIQELSPGNTVGTSSLLRAAQIKRLRPDLVPKPIRGNVETRIGKVESGEYNAAILAEAGLKRLGLEHKIAQILPSEQFMPAPGQGIIAGVTRRDNKHGIELLRSIDDDASRVEGETERQVAQILEAGCKVPVGVLARVRLTSVSIHACVFSLEGTEKLESNRVGPVDQALSLATEVGNDLLAKGAKKLEEGWRTVYA